MPKDLIKRYLPDHRTIRDHKHLRFFGRLLQDPNLWHLNRRSVAGALGIGIFIAFLPIPMQMVVSAAAAIWLRVNLALAVAVVWITNPLTMPPMFYMNYKVGEWLLGRPPHPASFELSIHWLMDQAQQLWYPLILGSVVMGAVCGLLAYVTVRVGWRLYIVRRRRRTGLRTSAAGRRA